jgi:hypothetical protein
MSENNGIEWLLLGSLDRRFRPKAGIDDAEMAAWKRPFNTSKCGHAGGALKVPLLAFRSD